MTVRSFLRFAPGAAFGALSILAGCGGTPADGGLPAGPAPRIVQAGAPGADAQVLDDAGRASLEGPAYTQADVSFMLGMIPHHRQALEMTALAGPQAAGEAVTRMALRMEISQRDEIRLMERWLEVRGEGGGAGHHDMLMPGMLTVEQMDELRTARGPEFDRLFLEYMIQHHEGALTMVATLLATPGAAQESEVFQFANDVDVDQRMEIARMRALLDEMR